MIISSLPVQVSLFWLHERSFSELWASSLRSCGCCLTALNCQVSSTPRSTRTGVPGETHPPEKKKKCHFIRHRTLNVTKSCDKPRFYCICSYFSEYFKVKKVQEDNCLKLMFYLQNTFNVQLLIFVSIFIIFLFKYFNDL